MYTYEQLKPEYSHLWSNCKVTRKAAATEAAQKVLDGKSTYVDLQTKTGVPWWFIGIAHLREADCNFHCHLHNGDPLHGRTYDVPKGRIPPPAQPPFTFEESAIDALKLENFLGIKDWCVERAAYCWEKFNGFGYRMRGFPSAYLWAGTNNYSHGKFVSDNNFSAYAVDTQLGSMAVLAELEQLDNTLKLDYNYDTDAGTYKANPPAPNPKEVLTDSRKWNFTVWKQRITVIIGGTIAAMQGFDVLGFVKTYGVWLALGGVAAYVIGDEIMKYWMKQDVSEGRHIPSGSVVNVDTGEPV